MTMISWIMTVSVLLLALAAWRTKQWGAVVVFGGVTLTVVATARWQAIVGVLLSIAGLALIRWEVQGKEPLQ